MSKDYMRYLAVQVINESKIFTYRMLSRELKVHCNAAKRMLYEFHAHENKKRPGSVHATYLIYGTQSAKTYYAIGDSQQDGEDVSMTSSPFMSSSMPQDEDTVEAPQKVMTVVREENLESVKAQFEEILSVHVYSLSPSPINNIHILSDCNRQILTKHRHEDPLEFGMKYGSIQNPRVKRRTGLRPPPPPAAVAEPSKTKTSKAEPTKAATKPAKVPEKATSNTNAAPKTEPKPVSQPKPVEKKPTEKKPGLKKEPSDIFKSFGKTKAPTAKLTREETDTSNASAAASIKEDEPMKDASESEQEEDFMLSSKTLPSNSSKSKPTGPSKSDREATLRKMMDEDSDEEMSDAGASKDQTPEPAPPPVRDPTPEPAPVVSGGRRRGRRKVMRKKTVKDEEGYIITREEPTWESFSEDEHPPPPSKKIHLPTPSTSTSNTKAGAKKGGAAKAGQGNIMNFFGKR